MTTQPPIPIDRTLPLVAPLWEWLILVCRRYEVAPELLLAVVLVETERAWLRPSDQLFAMSNQALDCMARWCPDRDPNPIMLVEIAYAAAHLNVQCRRFSRMTLALAAFCTDPEWVADQGDAFLDRPDIHRYIHQVCTLQAWLADARPWRPWEALTPPGQAA